MSLADKVDNVRSILTDAAAAADDVCDRDDLDDACWYYRTLARAFQRLQPGVRADELSAMAGELRRRTHRR